MDEKASQKHLLEGLGRCFQKSVFSPYIEQKLKRNGPMNSGEGGDLK